MRDRLTVFGIDIIKGSVRSRSKRPMYALVRMEGPAILSETEVSFYRLFRVHPLFPPAIPQCLDRLFLFRHLFFQGLTFIQQVLIIFLGNNIKKSKRIL